MMNRNIRNMSILAVLSILIVGILSITAAAAISTPTPSSESSSGESSGNVVNETNKGLGSPNIGVTTHYVSPYIVQPGKTATEYITVSERGGVDWAKDVTVFVDILSLGGSSFAETGTSSAAHYLGNIGRSTSKYTQFLINVPVSATPGQRMIRTTVRWYETGLFDMGKYGPYYAYSYAYYTVGASDRLNPGNRLELGEYIISPNGNVKLTLQRDGNLVLTSGTQILWASGTNGRSASYAIMRGDGNFVIYASSGSAIWSSNTQAYPGAQLIVKNDGRAVIEQSGIIRWAVPSITVTSPNGGESWKHGTVHTITWTKAGNPGTNVKIELLRGNTVNRVLTSSKSGTSYSWTIDPAQTPGTDYKVRITSTSNSVYTDTSNTNFIIVT